MRPRLLSAFRNTGYKAVGVRIRIGRRCDAMDRLLSAHGANAAVLVTAHNPRSRLMPPGWNQRMQAQLLQALRLRPVLPASGSLRHWTEAHLLVFGDIRPVRRLARRYRQFGIVIIRRRQPARLMLISYTSGW